MSPTMSVLFRHQLVALSVPRRGGAPRLALAARRWCASKSLVDCSKVYVKRDRFGGAGAFAAVDIKPGEVVEKGLARRLPVDGNTSAYVFTWSEDRSVWATGSGTSVFINASLDGSENTEMTRYYDEDRFEIHATKPIRAHEEVTHLYKSIDWRECFKELKAIRDAKCADHSAHVPVNHIEIDPHWQQTNLVECSKVYAKKDKHGGVGAFAAVPIKKGELVERGLARRLPVDGTRCAYVFTWSEDRTVWASGSGIAPFYNASLEGTENTKMVRFYDEDRFEIFALRDIAQDEELTHLYKSIDWRDCFQDLKAMRNKITPREGSVGKPPEDADRAKMSEYWQSDHSAPTLENMMLDSDAGDMDILERPEILSALPSLKGKRVLELGAGIGRFSGALAKKAGQVVAVDFVEGSCIENRKANTDKTNLQVLHADATMLELEPNSFDLVFSNWLLMYLTDEEVRNFAENTLRWLKPGGHLFFRESCFHASGNTPRRFNPTRYRDPETYSQIFSDAKLKGGERFQLQATNCVESYAQLKGNMHQMWFRWEKLGPAADNLRTRLLRTGQYSPAKTLRYEKIYGRGYIYTGGDQTSQRILNECSDWLVPGARLLDLGCGLGGTAVFLAEKCPGVYIHGVNTSGELMSILAGRHLRSSPDVRQRVTFDLAPEGGVPSTELNYAPNSFDVVVIRETLMYLEKQDKAVVLQKIQRLLRPGGRLVILDYVSGRPVKELSKELQSYFEEWGYFLTAHNEEEELINRYFEVTSSDITPDFVGFMDQGLSRIEEFFGPDSEVRAKVKRLSDPEALREPFKEQAKKLLDSDLPEEAATDAAAAAVEQVGLHVSVAKAEAKRCEGDYEWAQRIWQLERSAAAAGDLRWGIFLGTKRSGTGQNGA